MPAELNSQIQIDYDLGAIRKASEWLRASCKGVNPDYLAELELAVVEAVTNLVKYSGSGDRTEKFSLELSCCSDSIKIIITDTGKPISPAALDFSQTVLEFDPNDIDNLPTSGLGLAIIREVMDDFDYQTHNGVNTMRLTKRI